MHYIYPLVATPLEASRGPRVRGGKSTNKLSIVFLKRKFYGVSFFLGLISLLIGGGTLIQIVINLLRTFEKLDNGKDDLLWTMVNHIG